MGITLTSKEVPPLGVLGDKPWPPAADTATAQRIGGVRSSHGVWPRSGQTLGPERGSAEPRKARFFAEQKMRPDDGADGVDKLYGTLLKQSDNVPLTAKEK
jgi:hypothetical protein